MGKHRIHQIIAELATTDPGITQQVKTGLHRLQVTESVNGMEINQAGVVQQILLRNIQAGKMSQTLQYNDSSMAHFSRSWTIWREPMPRSSCRKIGSGEMCRHVQSACSDWQWWCHQTTPSEYVPAATSHQKEPDLPVPGA